MPAPAPEQPVKKPRTAAYGAKVKRHHKKWVAKYLEQGMAARMEIWIDRVSIMFADAVEAAGGDRKAAEGFIAVRRYAVRAGFQRGWFKAAAVKDLKKKYRRYVQQTGATNG